MSYHSFIYLFVYAMVLPGTIQLLRFAVLLSMSCMGVMGTYGVKHPIENGQAISMPILNENHPIHLILLSLKKDPFPLISY